MCGHGGGFRGDQSRDLTLPQTSLIDVLCVAAHMTESLRGINENGVDQSSSSGSVHSENSSVGNDRKKCICSQSTSPEQEMRED